MRLIERRYQCEVLLKMHQVLCDAQFDRLGLRANLFPHRDAAIRTQVRDGATLRLVRFRALERATLDGQRAPMLAHLAGAAEVGIALGAQPGQWTVCASGDCTVPDARFETDQGLVLVEFDAGGYSAGVIRDKVQAFQKEGRVVWAASSPLRAERVAQRYRGVKVYYAPWWEDRAERAATRSGRDNTLTGERRRRLLVP
jgi:hypothetical protein